MLTTQFLKSRTSTRDFIETTLDDKTLAKVNKIVEEEAIKLGKEDLRFIVRNDGADVYQALSGIAGYRGVMIDAPCYLALNTLNDDPASLVKGAYGIEDLITKLDEIGLGSCWITLNDLSEDIKKSLFNYEHGDIEVLLAIGHPVDQTVREHKFDDRKGIGELVYLNDFSKLATSEDLEHRGLEDIFSYARFAPSAYNNQPWRFVIVDDIIKLYIKDYKGSVNLLDAGIMMYYIDKLGESISMNSDWDIKPEINSDEYVYIASKQF